MEKKGNDKKKKVMLYPRFISNNPCGEDLFEGKSHEKIADCIAAQLKENENCNIIGIEGSWGSGKSNLVKLIKSKLQEKKDKKETSFYVYTYDVWGYQNDYLRRSVLENLMTFLTKNDDGPHFCKDWDDSLKRLLSRKETIGSRIVKEINVFTKLSIIMSLIFVAFTFIKDLYFRNFYDNNQWFKISITLTFFSIYILLLLINWKSYSKKYGDKDISFFKWIFHSYYDFKNDIQTSEDSISTNTVYESEASTREFKKYIKSINKELKKDRLIIVFDNIDRLPVEKVKEVWAMINILFANDDTPNINIIVPFDRNHIISAFREENIEIKNTNKQNNKTEVIKKGERIEIEKETVSYGDDFINKTFNVVFRVSPPTMSNWEDYFNKLWYQSFNNKVDSSVLQIYDLLSTIQTPRKIIAFINEFVAIKKVLNECNEEIPEKYIALFIFGKNAISLNPTSEILNPTYLGALDFLYKTDENLPKYISALYYQLPADKVLDIIYTDQIRKALDNKESSMLAEIKESSMFFGFLQHAITRVTNIEHAVLTLNESLKDNSDEENKQRIWDCLYKKVNTTETELEEYQKILLQNITNKKQYLHKIINDFYKNDKFNSILFAKNIMEIRELGFTADDCLRSTTLEPKEFVIFVQELKDEYDEFKIECDLSKLDEYLSSFNDVNDINQITALSYMNFGDNAFPKFCDKLQKLIETHKSNYDNSSILFKRLKELRRPTGKILDDASIINLFAHAKKEDEFYYDLLAMRITRITSYQGSNTNVIDGVINQNDEIIADKVANVIEYYINFGDLLGQIDQLSNHPLYNLVCRNLIKDSKGVSKANIAKLLTIYDKIITKIVVTPEEYIVRVNDWNKYLNKEISIENILNIPLNFFKDAKTINNETTEYCIKIAKDYLCSKTIDEWKDIIINEKKEYKLLDILDVDIENFFDAFKTLLIEYAEDKQPNLKKEVSNHICELATKKRRSLINTFKGVRDAFCNGSAKMSDAKFSFLGNWLFEFANLPEKKESLRTILPTQLNIFSKEENVKLLMENENTIIKMITISGEEADDFKRKIKDLMINNYKENTEFSDFAKNIGIEIEEETDKTES